MLGLALLVPVLKTYFAGNPLSYMYPNFLLFTPFREEARQAWKDILIVDTAVKRAPTQIPTIDAADYSFESLREATDNFRHPAVVRGFFSNSPAVKKWLDPAYLNSKIGDYEIPVVLKAEYNTGQNERGVMPFREAFTEVMEDPNSKKYLFFPVQSRENFNGSAAGTANALKEKINEVIKEDLDLDRIFQGELFHVHGYKMYCRIFHLHGFSHASIDNEVLLLFSALFLLAHRFWWSQAQHLLWWSAGGRPWLQ